MTLLDQYGKPIHSDQFARTTKKFPVPLVGELTNPWVDNHRAPGRRQQNMLQFDTSQLTLEHFRMMRDHHQVNSSLTLLSFLLHQTKWRVQGDHIKSAKFCEDNLREVWTRLVRALSKAFVYGFSPNALQWENEIGSRRVVLSKIKDLRPEECMVNWKEIQGVQPRTSAGANLPRRKVKVYDGIDQMGAAPIPVANSLWYPLMMEDGDYYGTKLLARAFQPWYFSTLIHMYANRYYERFGEPVLVSRAPFDEKIDIGNGREIQGNILMAGLNNMVRNGSSVTLPNTRAMNGLDGVNNYEFTMEYLESQMRGADFERMLTRYDQEISLALFTPLLMMNAADGGSFNLGVVHTQMYKSMLNALAADWKEYIDRYVLAPMARLNFGPNVTPPTWEFRDFDGISEETLRTVINALTSNGNGDKSVKFDLDEIGQEVGLTMTEIEKVTEPEKLPPPATEGGSGNDAGGKVASKGAEKRRDTRVGRPEREGKGKGLEKRSTVAHALAERLTARFAKALHESVPAAEFEPDLGFRKQLAEVAPELDYDAFAGRVGSWVKAYYEIQSAPEAEPLKSTIGEVLARGIERDVEELSDVAA